MNDRSKRISTGEARIRSAFRVSLTVVAVLLAAAALVYWLLRQPPAAPQAVMETPVRGPEPVRETAGETPPPTHFTDITKAAGIEFVHVSGAYGERLMPETIGSGLAFIDYDGDQDQDLFLVNSSDWPGHETEPPPHQALYRNDGGGRFADVSAEAGLALNFYGMGAAVGDYDNDGRDDLFVTAVGSNHLFHNEGGHFREVSAEAGVAGRDTDWSSGASFVDYDNDGDLDLFVGNYVKWSPAIDLQIDFRLTGLGRAYGAPNHFVGTNSYLYRNEGDGRFRNVSRQAGIQIQDPQSQIPVGKALGIAPVDYDRDGWTDILVANDTVRNFLFHNLGDGRFEEVGAFEGIAYDRDGKATSAMGIDAAWFRNDEDLGVAIGNFGNEMSSLFVTTDGRAPFADDAILEGFGPASRQVLTFAVLFLDYDLDGRLDLFQANGHLEHEINRVQPSQHYAQPAQLFWNCGPECRLPFHLVASPGELSQPLVARGAAYADIDGDGDLDIAIAQNGRPAVLLRNDQQTGHHWLRIRLVGTHSNRNAIGARIELSADGRTQRRQVMPTHGFLSQTELPVTFGLGASGQVERLRILWPGGNLQEVAVDGVDRTLVIEQADDGGAP